MSITQQIKTNNTKPSAVPLKTSALTSFSLGFEYDKSLKEIKQQVRARTI